MQRKKFYSFYIFKHIIYYDIGFLFEKIMIIEILYLLYEYPIKKHFYKYNNYIVYKLISSNYPEINIVINQ